MSKKAPWWRKPLKKNENEDEKDQNNDNEDFEGRRRDPSEFVDSREDWSQSDRRLRRSPFDSEFDSIFGRSSLPFSLKDDFFMDIEREFADMHEKMDNMFKHAMKGDLEKSGPGGPFVYGFSMRTGSDGVPNFQEFGNMPPEMRSQFRLRQQLPSPGAGEMASSCKSNQDPRGIGSDFRKPLTDILECGDHISVTMELPGVEKKDINLEIIDNELDVNVETPKRRYSNKLPLPSEVNPETIDATFKNGVLEVTVKPIKPEKKKGKKIKID